MSFSNLTVNDFRVGDKVGTIDGIYWGTVISIDYSSNYPIHVRIDDSNDPSTKIGHISEYHPSVLNK